MSQKKGYVKAVIGCQFGDEGKGKIVDFLAQDAHIVVRYSGGGNAGHTVENPLGDFKARIVPVGMFSPATQLNIIGSGVALSLGTLVEEVTMLGTRSIDFTSLRIDKNTHLVMPWHLLEDRLDEEMRGVRRLGTTGSGIGPCYSDKYRRTGFRAGDLLNFTEFRKRFIETYHQKAKLFSGYYEHWNALQDPEILLHEIEVQLEYLAGFFGSLDKLVCNTVHMLWGAIDKGQNILLEGAQGFLLDIDHGTYSYVTSSNTGVTSAAEGSGIAPRDITEVIGVAKAYMSRVGEGPFPTRATPEDEERLRELGNEYGTVTGRPRKCGWFDTASFRMVIRKNGLTGLAITRLDILDNFQSIGVGIGYNCHARIICGGDFCRHEHCADTSHAFSLPDVRAVIEQKSGWGPKKSVKECGEWGSLPKEARAYITEISCGVPIKLVSVGSRREETIVVKRGK